MSWSIYFLIDPRSKKIRYIGLSNDPYVRFEQHLHDEGKSHKTNWIKILRKQNLLPILEIVEKNLTDEQSKIREQYWIKHIGRKNLTNETDGGDGLLNPDRKTLRQIKRKMKKLWRTDEYGAKMSIAMSTKEYSPEIREEMKKWFEEWWGKIF